MYKKKQSFKTLLVKVLGILTIVILGVIIILTLFPFINSMDLISKRANTSVYLKNIQQSVLETAVLLRKQNLQARYFPTDIQGFNQVHQLLLTSIDRINQIYYSFGGFTSDLTNSGFKDFMEHNTHNSNNTLSDSFASINNFLSTISQAFGSLSTATMG